MYKLLNSLLMSVGLIFFPIDVSAQNITGTASVIDGDTLEIRGNRIRLHGIDAPESGQNCQANDKNYRCGQHAALALSDKIGSSNITCRGTDSDRYGRVIAICYLGNKDLNAWMVTQGWAIAYRQYSTDYVSNEENAKTANRGIWRGPFVIPSQWRRGARLNDVELVSSDGECQIKGNINKEGEKIFHIPGGRWYKKTKIDSAKGEQMFCSEQEAISAGWRKSYQ